MNEYPPAESFEQAIDPKYSLFELLQSAQDQLVKETEELEMNRPEKLANVSDQLEFGRKAAMLRGKGELLQELLSRVGYQDQFDKTKE